MTTASVSTVVKILSALHNSSLTEELGFYKKPLRKTLGLSDSQVALIDFQAIANLITQLSKELSERPKPPARKLMGKPLEDIKSTAEADEPCLLDVPETTEEEDEVEVIREEKRVGFGPVCVDLEQGEHDYKAFTALRSIMRASRVEGEITRDDEYLYLTLEMSVLNRRDMDTLGGVLVGGPKRERDKDTLYQHTYRFSKCLLEDTYDRFQQMRNTSGETKAPVVLNLGQKKTKSALAQALDQQGDKKVVDLVSDSDSDSESDVEEDEVKMVVVAKSPRKQPLPVEGETWVIKTKGREERAQVISVTGSTVCLGWRNGTEDVMEWIDEKSGRLVRKVA